MNVEILNRNNSTISINLSSSCFNSNSSALMPNLLSKKQKYAILSLHFTALKMVRNICLKSSLSHHVVHRGVASDISKGELTEQLIYSLFLHQPVVVSSWFVFVF